LELHLSHEQYGFVRGENQESIMVWVNAAMEEKSITLPKDKIPHGVQTQHIWRDMLTGEEFSLSPQGLQLRLNAVSLRILLSAR
jgi:hypothetical protein